MSALPAELARGLVGLQVRWGVVRIRAERLARRVGWGAGLCLMLALLALGSQLLLLQPALDRIERLREAAALRPPLKTAIASHMTNAFAQVAAVRSALRPLAEGPAQLQALVAETKSVWRWEEARFTQSVDAPLGLTRLKIHVTGKTDYPTLQIALERVMLRFDNLALDELQLKRPEGDDGRVEVRLQLSLWLDGIAERSEAEHQAFAGRDVKRP